MVSYSSGGWKWHFVSREMLDAVGPHPEAVLTAVTPMHRACERKFVRDVRYRDGFYYKTESYREDSRLHRLATRFRSRIKSEFAALLLLRKLGIAAVEPAAYGTCGSSATLITREASEMVSVREYVLRHIDEDLPLPDEFLIGWGGIISQLLRHGLYLPDFHCGNLLCDASGRRFTVVDPQARRSRFNRRTRTLRMIKRQFGIAIENLPRAAILKIMSAIAPEDPAGFFRQVLEFSAEYVRDSQMRGLKRLKRFRRGDHTVTVDGVEYKFSNEEQRFTLDDTEKLILPEKAATELWERDYILSLYRMPLLRIVARTADGKTLFRKCGRPAKPDRESEELLYERLKLTGFPAEEFAVAADRHGRIVLADRKFQR